ncbi:MAG: hypothetical protein V1891_04705 [bacterium]
MKQILQLNANLKFIEYLLFLFDNESDEITLREIKDKFIKKFKTNPTLLNQYFGIIRLLPLILIKETYKNLKTELVGNVASIKIIRDSIAHNSFKINESGYIFKNDTGKVSFSYEEFTSFLHEIEKEFYNKINV